MADKVMIIEQFLADWSKLDAERLGGYFAENGTYDAVSFEPVTGRGAIIEFFEDILAGWLAIESEILNILSEGNLVVAERVDRIRTAKGDVDTPCVGVFEMEDGQIKVWRDYFDVNGYYAVTRTNSSEDSGRSFT